MKVIVLNAVQGEAIWNALIPHRPEITACLCIDKELGKYLGTDHILVAPKTWWNGLSQGARNRVCSGVQLLCLYEADPSDNRDHPSSGKCPLVQFGPSQILPKIIVSVCKSLVGGDSLGETTAIRARLAWCAKEFQDWRLMVARPAPPALGERKVLPPGQQPFAIELPPAMPISSASISIGSVTVQGNLIQGTQIEIAASGTQPLQVNADGPITLVQHSDGDQVNLNTLSQSPSFVHQTAHVDQVNINRMAPEAASPAPAPGLCRACGARHDPDARFCTQCGAHLEAG